MADREELADLSAAIADLDVAMDEATKLRTAEKAHLGRHTAEM